MRRHHSFSGHSPSQVHWPPSALLASNPCPTPTFCFLSIGHTHKTQAHLIRVLTNSAFSSLVPSCHPPNLLLAQQVSEHGIDKAPLWVPNCFSVTAINPACGLTMLCG